MGDPNIRIIGFSRLKPPKSRSQKLRERIARSLILLRPDTTQQKRRRRAKTPVNVVCISDTHNAQPPLSSGDVLIHAGDLTQRGSLEEAQAQLDWLAAQSGFAHKVVIAGNHDFALRDARASLSFEGIQYLEDETVTLTLPSGRSLRIRGTPWTPEYGTWAFQYPRPLGSAFWADPAREILQDLDILVVHGPPRGHCDTDPGNDAGMLGCAGLANAIHKARPRLVVCGHIHGARGREEVVFDRAQVAYEKVMEGGRWALLVGLVLGLFGVWFRRIFGIEEAVTTIVNASHAPPAPPRRSSSDHESEAESSRADDDRGAFVVCI